MAWIVYVLSSETATLTYVGITSNLERRVRQHNGLLEGGARTTRRSRPWIVASSFGPYSTRGTAQRIEWQIKRLRGTRRLSWRPASGRRAGRPGRSPG